MAAIVPAGCARRGIGADRVEAAVGEIEDVEDAEDERQPDRHDEQPGRIDQSIDKDRRREIHASSLKQGTAEASNTLAPAPTSNLSGQVRFVSRTCQLHLAPAKPSAIQSAAFTPAGGFTHSAGKWTMSTSFTILASASHLVRPAAFD